MAGALVLFSGGLDSTVALYYALNTMPGPIYTLTFVYGQRHEDEIHAASKITRLVLDKFPEKFDGGWVRLIPRELIPGSSSILGDCPVKEYDKIPNHEESQDDPAFIPHRNLLFLSIAAGWARHFKVSTIVTGLRGGFSDCTVEFEKRLTSLLDQSDPGWPLTVFSPVHKSRTETIRMARDLNGCWEALAHTMTCFKGFEPPCGKCLPCLKRAEGFAKAGEKDPLLVRVEKERNGQGEVL